MGAAAWLQIIPVVRANNMIYSSRALQLMSVNTLCLLLLKPLTCSMDFFTRGLLDIRHTNPNNGRMDGKGDGVGEDGKIDHFN